MDITRKAFLALTGAGSAAFARSMVYRADLFHGTEEWLAEGTGRVDVSDRWLHVWSRASENSPPSHMVVWNRRVFPASFELDFEMSPDGSSSGLAIVFFCAAGANGEDLFDPALPRRTAEYAEYHSGAIANYSDAYWSRNTEAEAVSNRLRKNPGFQLVAEGPSRTANPVTGSTDLVHRIRIVKGGADIRVTVNGKQVVRWRDPGSPLGAGRIGLRSMSGVTRVSYRNFKVRYTLDLERRDK